MTRLTFHEWADSGPVPLTVPQRDALARMAPNMLIRPAPGQSDAYVLRPDSTVGTIVLDDLSIAVLPKAKVPVERVLYLLSYSLGLETWSDAQFEYDRDSLLEVIVPAFVTHVRRALRRGLLQGYRTEEDSLPLVRGRLRIEDQLRRRYARFPPAEVRFDEYSEDVEVNRILRAAGIRLLRMSLRSDQSRQALLALDAMFERVTPVEYHPSNLPGITWTRLNEHYRGAVELGKLVLMSTAFELPQRHRDRSQTVRASSFLVDMNMVFEEFVRTNLREKLRLATRQFPKGGKHQLLTLDDRGYANGRVKLEPDLSWWESATCRFVGDAKYKRTDRDGENGDLYQLLAYVVAANLGAGLLVYAAGEAAPTIHTVRYLGKELHVAALDLSVTAEELDAQIVQLAGLVRRLANSSTPQGRRAFPRSG